MHDLDRVQTEFEEGFDLAPEPDEREAESSGVYQGNGNGRVFDDAEEMELAAELLDVQDEGEMEQFLSGWIRKFGRKARQVLKTPIRQLVSGTLKGAIQKALPGVAGAAGNLLLPGVGGGLAGKLASSAGSLLGLELEGLSPEDQEFEAALQVVRLGTEAMKNAANAGDGYPEEVAARALSAAAQRYAPGLLRGNGRGNNASGRWYRRGSRIILEGV
jgi:hypothetical protein